MRSFRLTVFVWNRIFSFPSNVPIAGKRRSETEALQSPGLKGAGGGELSASDALPSVPPHRHQRSAASSPQSTRSPHSHFLDGIAPATAPGNQPSTAAKQQSWMCCCTAAPCAFNHEMQLTEAILHSPVTSLQPSPVAPPPPQACHQNAGPVWRTTHTVIINKRR